MGNNQTTEEFYDLDLFDENIYNSIQIACVGRYDRNSEFQTQNHEDYLPLSGLQQFQNKLKEYNSFYRMVKGEIEEIQQIKNLFMNTIDRIKIKAIDSNKKIDEAIEEQYLYIVLYLIHWNMSNEENSDMVGIANLRFTNYVPGVIVNDVYKLPNVLREKYEALKTLLENLPEFLNKLYDLGMKMIDNVVKSRDEIRTELFNIAKNYPEVSIKDFGYTEVRFVKNFQTISKFAIELEELFRSCKVCLEKANRIIRICCEKVNELKRVVDEIDRFEDYDNPKLSFRKNVTKFITDKLINS